MALGCTYTCPTTDKRGDPLIASSSTTLLSCEYVTYNSFHTPSTHTTRRRYQIGGDGGTEIFCLYSPASLPDVSPFAAC
jgi:hypothetical protein